MAYEHFFSVDIGFAWTQTFRDTHTLNDLKEGIELYLVVTHED